MEEVAFKATFEGWVSCQHDSTEGELMEDMNFTKLFHDQDNFFSCDTLKFVFVNLVFGSSQNNSPTKMSLS